MKGPLEVISEAILGAVYLVMAMVMSYDEYPEATWNYAQLARIYNGIMDQLLRPSRTTVQSMSASQLLHGLQPGVSPAYDTVVWWINRQSGIHVRVSLQHVINYVFYVDGAKPLPSSLEGAFGTSFCDAPSPPPSSSSCQYQPEQSPANAKGGGATIRYSST